MLKKLKKNGMICNESEEHIQQKTDIYLHAYEIIVIEIAIGYAINCNKNYKPYATQHWPCLTNLLNYLKTIYEWVQLMLSLIKCTIEISIQSKLKANFRWYTIIHTYDIN